MGERSRHRDAAEQVRDLQTTLSRKTTRKRISQTPLKRFRPIPLTAIGVAAFVVWTWLTMSTMDYGREVSGSGLRTAGWFVLGMPFLLVFAALSSMPFSMISRKGYPRIAWIALIAFFSIVICHAYTESLPDARLRRALEVEIPSDVVIDVLREQDSFNDGMTTFGIVRAAPAFRDLLVDYHALHESRGATKILQWLPDASIPQDGLCYRGERLTVYYDSDSSLLYFVRL